MSCYIVGYVWRIYKYFIKLCAALASFCERAGICLCGMMMRLELGSPLLQRSTTRRHQDLAEPKPRPIPLPSPLMIIKASCEARRALWLIDGWMSFWLASFHCVVIINSRGHILFIGKRIFANVIVIFLAQLSFVNCGLAERVPFCVCVPFVFCVWVCVCYVATGNGILQSHAHVSAGCLCSFSLIKPGSQQPRGTNAPNWISISQVNWVTKVDSCCKHRYIQIMDKGKQYTHRQASCLFPFKFHALCILTGYCSSIYTNIWRL